MSAIPVTEYSLDLPRLAGGGIAAPLAFVAWPVMAASAAALPWANGLLWILPALNAAAETRYS
jgi:hypothetical protein